MSDNDYLRNWSLETLCGVRDGQRDRQRAAQRVIEETMDFLAAIDAELDRRAKETQ